MPRGALATAQGVLEPGGSCLPDGTAVLIAPSATWSDYQLGDIVWGYSRYNYTKGPSNFVTERNVSLAAAFPGSLATRYAAGSNHPGDLRTLTQLARDGVPHDMDPSSVCALHIRLGDVIDCDIHSVTEMLLRQVKFRRNASTCAGYPDQTQDWREKPREYVRPLRYFSDRVRRQMDPAVCGTVHIVAGVHRVLPSYAKSIEYLRAVQAHLCGMGRGPHVRRSERDGQRAAGRVLSKAVSPVLPGPVAGIGAWFESDTRPTRTLRSSCTALDLSRRAARSACSSSVPAGGFDTRTTPAGPARRRQTEGTRGRLVPVETRDLPFRSWFHGAPPSSYFPAFLLRKAIPPTGVNLRCSQARSPSKMFAAFAATGFHAPGVPARVADARSAPVRCAIGRREFATSAAAAVAFGISGAVNAAEFRKADQSKIGVSDVPIPTTAASQGWADKKAKLDYKIGQCETPLKCWAEYPGGNLRDATCGIGKKCPPGVTAPTPAEAPLSPFGSNAGIGPSYTAQKTAEPAPPPAAPPAA